MKYVQNISGLSFAHQIVSILIASHIVVAGVAVSMTTPRPAFAQTGGASRHAGVSVPRGAESVSDRKLTAGMGRFLGNSTAKHFDLPEQAGNAEVYFWTGANYKPGRFGFARTQMQEALTSAGYTYRELGDADNKPNPYEEEWDMEALDFQPVDGRPTFFAATNSKTRVTVVGVWFDQASHKRMVLGIARAGFVAEEKRENILPDIAGPNTILVKDLNNAMKGVPPPPMPAFPKMTARPKTASGMVKDGSGKPIAGAKIIVQASAAGGFRTSVTGRTNAQGIYNIPLPVGVCEVVNADCQVTYHGQTYLLPLHPMDGELDNFPSSAGHIENFVLRTSGATSLDSSSSYGGTIRLICQTGIKGGIVEVTLTPDGPMLDGSKGKTLVFRFPSSDSQAGSEHFLKGIPIGRYTLKSRVYDSGDALPLRAKETFGDEEPITAYTVLFEAKQGNVASLSSSGVKQQEVLLKP